LLAVFAGLLGFWNDPSADGLKALDDKRYDAAVQSFTAAVAADPKDFSAHFNLAFSFGMLHRDADAISEYRKAIDLKPDLYEAQLNLGIVLIRDKQPADAAVVLEKAVSKKPKEYRPVYYLGEALLASGNAEASQKAFATAAELNPKSAFAELGLARSLVRQNKLDDAAPHFHKAADLDPSHREYLLELAAADETAGKTDDAIALYAQFPNDAGAQERLGQLLLQSDKADEAVAHFQASVQQSPTAANRVGLIQAYLKTHHPELALPLIDQALAAAPGDYDLLMLKARIVRDQRKFDVAAPLFLQAAQLRPNDWMAWSELANLLVMMENYPGAIAALDHVRGLNAEKPGHFFLRAIVLDKIQEQEHGGRTHREAMQGALASYQKFLELSAGTDPNNEFKARQRIKAIQLEMKER